MVESLWGEEFSVKEDNIKTIINKAKKAKEVSALSLDKKLASKYVSIADKLKLINTDVHKVLGNYADNTIVIRDYNDFVKYIDKACENGFIAIDTETNNTLDVYGDCKIMGLCLYTPGEKNAYIPVNHCYYTVEEDARGIEKVVLGEKLPNQITEEQINKQLARVQTITKIFHNATFDIQVIMRTCNIRLKADWDTMIAAQLIDENELKGLKAQYKLHINPEQDKYDIEGLFKGLPYAIFDPELFALYAATDARMTYELYKWQLDFFTKKENTEVYWLLENIEIPCIDAIVDMESTGINVNSEYAEKMSKIYNKKSEEAQLLIDEELKNLQEKIDLWKLTPEANARPKIYVAKKTKMTEAKILDQYPYTEPDGRHYKYAPKSLVNQLSDPIDLNSSTQLAILLYDILKVPVLESDKPRSTSKATLDELAETYHVKICTLIKNKRAIDILINTFIDAIPEFKRSDGKVHARFNQVGTLTGRLSSESPNLQNIPSHDKTIRMIFSPSTEYANHEVKDNTYEVFATEDVEVAPNKWVKVSNLKIGDSILNSESTYDIITNININGNKYILEVK